MFFAPVSVSRDKITSMTSSSDLLGKSESLTATDVSELPHHRSPVSLLVYSEYADLATDSLGEFKNTMNSIRSTYNLPFGYENLTDYMDLESKLWDYDIFLIPEQEQITTEALSNIANAWSGILNEWVNAGGIVILLDCYSMTLGAGPTMRIYNQTGLMNAEPITAGSGYPVYNVNTTSPLTQGVDPSWTCFSGTVLFSTSDGNVVVNNGTAAVVAHKVMGRGHVVLIGFDFFNVVSNQEVILANAIRLHRHIVFDESHNPYRTINTNYNQFVLDLNSLGYACSAMTTFNPEYLQACDVLVLTSCMTLYNSTTEVNVIEEFVSQGGGLFVVSDWGPYGTQLDPVIERFDFVRNTTDTLRDSNDNVTMNSAQFALWGENIKYHSATMNVLDIEIYAGTGFVEMSPDAVPLIVTDSDGTATFDNEMIANQTAVSAALTVGKGRIIVFGDSNALDNSSDTDSDTFPNYQDAYNDVFLQNSIRWLTAAGLEEVSVVFDESHSPNLPLSSALRGLAELLTENGFTVYRMATFDPEYMADKDVLFILDGYTDYNPGEIQIIKDFVAAGKGLLLLACYGIYGQQIQPIADQYGIVLDTSGSWLETNISFFSYFNESHFSDHPIMDGITRIEFGAATGFTDIGSSTPLVTTSDDGVYKWGNGSVANNVPVVTAQEFAQGRIVVSAEYVSMRYDWDSDSDGIMNLYDSDNSHFWINVLSWLSENRAPTVHVTSPNGGETFSSDELITWTAVDGNNDPMTYNVLYSDDNGGSWSTLATGLSSTSYLWDTATFDDGVEYRIRVTATDGELTGQDASNAVFTVDNNGPAISGISHYAETNVIVATVTDISGVDTVLCNYSLDGGTWMLGEMSLGSGDIYSITLGPFASDTSVQYRIGANDTLGFWSAFSSIDGYTYTAPTTTTGSTNPPPVVGDNTLLLIIIVVGAAAVVIIIVIVMKKRQ